MPATGVGLVQHGPAEGGHDHGHRLGDQGVAHVFGQREQGPDVGLHRGDVDPLLRAARSPELRTLHQQRNALEVVDGAIDLLQPRHQQRESFVQQVGVVGALRVAAMQQVGHRATQGAEVECQRGRRRGARAAVGDQVPVGLHAPGDLTHRVEAGPGRQQHLHGQRGGRVLEQPGADLGPPPLAAHVGGDLVHRADDRRKPGLDRVLHEQSCGERVQGSDGGKVELVQGGPGARGHHRVPSAAQAGQLGAHPVAHLGRRLLGEGHGRDRPHGYGVRALGDQSADAVDENPGLARAGTGGDEDRVVERRARAVSCLLVGQGECGHAGSPSVVPASPADPTTTPA